MSYQCEECRKEFKSFSALQGHIGGAHCKDVLPIRHGTQWGYQKHLIQGSDPCQSCKAAHARHNRKYPQDGKKEEVA